MAVDLDLRKPELHAYLNAAREPGAGVLEALLASDDGRDEDRARLLARGRRDLEIRRHGPVGARDASRPPAAGVYTDDDVTAGLVELARVRGQRPPRRPRAQGRGPRHLRVHPAPVEGRPRRALRRDPRGARARHGRRSAPAAADRRQARAGRRADRAGAPAAPVRRSFAQDADYVLVDTVPVSTVADASAVAAAADGVILVVDLAAGAASRAADRQAPARQRAREAHRDRDQSRGRRLPGLPRGRGGVRARVRARAQARLGTRRRRARAVGSRRVRHGSVVSEAATMRRHDERERECGERERADGRRHAISQCRAGRAQTPRQTGAAATSAPPAPAAMSQPNRGRPAPARRPRRARARP